MSGWQDPKPSSRAVLLGGLWLLGMLTAMIMIYASVIRPLFDG